MLVEGDRSIMNDELKELMRQVLVTEALRKNLVTMTYEEDSEGRETIERVSLVYEVKSLNEGFD